jgi:predicted MPP superfamily phosphohydrolase
MTSFADRRDPSNTRDISQKNDHIVLTRTAHAIEILMRDLSTPSISYSDYLELETIAAHANPILTALSFTQAKLGALHADETLALINDSIIASPAAKARFAQTISAARATYRAQIVEELSSTYGIEQLTRSDLTKLDTIIADTDADAIKLHQDILLGNASHLTVYRPIHEEANRFIELQEIGLPQQSLQSLTQPEAGFQCEATAPYEHAGRRDGHHPPFLKQVLENIPGIIEDIRTPRIATLPPQVQRTGCTAVRDDVDIIAFDVTIADLPQAFDRYRILHATDLHLSAEDQTPLERLRAIYNRLTIRKELPDCMIITGDFVHESYLGYTPEARQHLQQWIRAGVPIFYVLGNHDNRDGQREILKTLLDESGATDITNSDWSLWKQNQYIYLTGLDDVTSGFPWMPSTVGRTDAPRILAMHNPESFSEDALASVSLMLAGHIHQGEVRIGFSRDGRHYVDGISLMKRDPESGYKDLYQIQEWASIHKVPLYVSAGLSRRWEHKGFPFSLRKRNPRCSVALHTLKRDTTHDL